METKQTEKMVIYKTQNGYVTMNTDGEGEYRAPTVQFSFESLDRLFDHIRQKMPEGFSVRHLRQGFNIVQNATDACDDTKTSEELRDELGELRRFKERAVRRDEELRASLEKSVKQAADFMGQRDRYAVDNMNLEAERDQLRTKLDKRAKRRK